MDERDHPQTIRNLLGEVGRKLGLRGAVETGVLWRRWPEVVGDTVAAHAEPTSLRDGVLRVRADSPTWATELGYLATQIVARANEVAGTEIVKELKVWTGPGRNEAPTASRSEVKGPPVERPVYEDPREAFEGARAAWNRKRSGGP